MRRDVTDVVTHATPGTRKIAGRSTGESAVLQGVCVQMEKSCLVVGAVEGDVILAEEVL